MMSVAFTALNSFYQLLNDVFKVIVHSQSGREGRKGSCGAHHQRAKAPVESSFERMFVASKKNKICFKAPGIFSGRKLN